MNKIKYKLASPVLMWLAVAAGIFACALYAPAGLMFGSTVLGKVALALAALNWIYIGILSLRVHRKAPQSVHSINQLVTEGAYAVVRHPLYLADMVLAWAVFLAYPAYRVLAAVIWLTIVLVFWANWEERLLEEKFLDDYRAYKQRVPMFWPKWQK